MLIDVSNKVSNIDGRCYELLDEYKILRAENEINVKKMQLDMIEYDDASLPVTFSGFIFAPL